MTDTDPTKTTAKKAEKDEPAKTAKHTPVNDDQDATVGTAPAKQPATAKPTAEEPKTTKPAKAT
jgi:hypothetical protein